MTWRKGDGRVESLWIITGIQRAIISDFGVSSKSYRVCSFRAHSIVHYPLLLTQIISADALLDQTRDFTVLIIVLPGFLIGYMTILIQDHIKYGCFCCCHELLYNIVNKSFVTKLWMMEIGTMLILYSIFIILCCVETSFNSGTPGHQHNSITHCLF